MGKLFDELMKEEHWFGTYERMLEKQNFTTKQLAEIIGLYESKYHLSVLKEVKEGTFKWGKCEKQLLNKIGTDRKRTVYIYSIADRYILGGLYRAFSAYYSDKVSDNVFSYKKGVRTISAIEYLMSDKDLVGKYGLKLDISAYFNSVNRECLVGMIDELSYGEVELREMLCGILLNDEVWYNNEKIDEYKSLIPGTPFSSFLANYSLKDVDNYIAINLGITYARYSDDIIMFADTTEELQLGLDSVRKKLGELGLKINPDKYEWYEPGDVITYLGLKLEGTKIDISDNSAMKYKKKIRRATRDGRKLMETKGVDGYKQAKKMLARHNHRVYKCYIQDASKFGWAYYAFRYVNTLETLRELDFYLKDRIRQMITGRNNSANIKKVTDEMLVELGYISLCDMYIKFTQDFDMYCDTVDLIRT